MTRKPTKGKSVGDEAAAPSGGEDLPERWSGDRWAALEPIRQGVHHAFGAFRKDVARGLAVRCDWGPQYIADAWIQEVK
jgi:hypothetical protein